MAETFELRARIGAHEQLKAAAEAQLAEMAAGRTAALVAMTDEELMAFDAEAARLARAVERADAHLDLLRPALAAAETREADAAERARTVAERAAFDEMRRQTLGQLGPRSAEATSFAQAALAANAPAGTGYARDIFEPKIPVATYGDTPEWWAEREARLRREGQGALPTSRPGLTALEFGRPNTSDPIII